MLGGQAAGIPGSAGRAGVADPGSVKQHHPAADRIALPGYEQLSFDPVHPRSL
jgi:hypothetical protein